MGPPRGRPTATPTLPTARDEVAFAADPIQRPTSYAVSSRLNESGGRRRGLDGLGADDPCRPLGRALVAADPIQRLGARVVSIGGRLIESGAAGVGTTATPTLPTAADARSRGRPDSTARCSRGFYKGLNDRYWQNEWGRRTGRGEMGRRPPPTAWD